MCPSVRHIGRDTSPACPPDKIRRFLFGLSISMFTKNAIIDVKLWNSYRYSIIGGLSALFFHSLYLVAEEIQGLGFSVWSLAGLTVFFRLGMVFHTWLMLSMAFTTFLIFLSKTATHKVWLWVLNLIFQPFVLVFLMFAVSFEVNILFVVIICNTRATEYSSIFQCIHAYFSSM